MMPGLFLRHQPDDVPEDLRDGLCRHVHPLQLTGMLWRTAARIVI